MFAGILRPSPKRSIVLRAYTTAFRRVFRWLLSFVVMVRSCCGSCCADEAGRDEKPKVLRFDSQVWEKQTTVAEAFIARSILAPLISPQESVSVSSPLTFLLRITPVHQDTVPLAGSYEKKTHLTKRPCCMLEDFGAVPLRRLHRKKTYLSTLIWI